jgi:hypothetical protein
VNVYAVVPIDEVLTVEFHVPVIAGILVELVGKTGGVAPWHTGAIAVKVGVIEALKLTTTTSLSVQPYMFVPTTV